MSSNSDDSVSLSGSKSELDLDDIFGESDKDDNHFEEFLNKKIPAEIQRQGLWKADNCQHFTSFNAANAGSSRNNTEKNPAKNFGLFLNEEILVNINTWINRNAAEKQSKNLRQHRTPRTPVKNTSKLRAFFGIWMAMNDFIEKPLDGVLQVTGGKEREQYLCQYTE